IGALANVGASNLDHATAIGADAVVASSNTIVLGRVNDTVIASGFMRVAHIPFLPSVAKVCFNPAGDLLQCDASSLRFKRNVQPYRAGLEIIRRLRPISFNWKEDMRPDIGLAAEEVVRVAPALTFNNEEGELTGVNYDRLNVLLINA